MEMVELCRKSWLDYRAATVGLEQGVGELTIVEAEYSSRTMEIVLVGALTRRT